jgi:hypothetical protein
VSGPLAVVTSRALEPKILSTFTLEPRTYRLAAPAVARRPPPPAIDGRVAGADPGVPLKGGRFIGLPVGSGPPREPRLSTCWG